MNLDYYYSSYFKILNKLVIWILFVAVSMVNSFFVMNYPGIASAQFANTTDVLNIRDSGITVSNISETGFLPEIIVKPKEPTFRSDNFSDQILSESPLLSDSIQSLSDSLESPAFKANASEINNTDTFLIDLKPKLESEMPAFLVAPKLEDHLLAALEEVRNDPNVELAEPNEVYEAQYEEALVDYNISQAEKQAHENQYITNGFDRIDGDIAINKLRNLSTAVDIDIAILDSGISPHIDLNVLTDRQVNFAGTSPVDNCGHGTHVAGIAAAKDNEFGIVGAAPGARLWNVKVLDGNPKKCEGTKDSLIDGLNYVSKHADEIDVVNLSLGGFCDPNVRKLCNSPVLESAINNVIAKGIIVVVAAGNDGVDSINWKPAKFLSVLTVSNLNDSDGKCGGAGNATYRGNDDFLANNTNYGSQVHIAAPGVNILSTSNNGSYAIYSGTSMAAPYVAGSAALYKSFNPNASVSEVINTLLSQSVSLGDRCDGNGYGYILGGDKDNIPEPVLNIKDLIEQ